MRWVLPALAVSVALHGAMLGYVGPGSDNQPGSDAQVTSTVIVFDSPPALTVSAADGADHDAAVNAAAEGKTGPEDPLAPPPVIEETPQEAAAIEPEPQQVDEPAMQDEEVIERPAQHQAANADAARKQQAQHDAAGRRKQAEDRRKQRAAKAAADRKAKQAAADRKAKQAAGAKAKSKAKAEGKASGSKASRQAGTGRSGGASAGDKRAYARKVLSHIQRYKRYPSGTSASGVVRLAVSISGSGALRSANVRGSSGHSALDRAAVATARAASPYPAPPGGGGFSFTVSLRYTR